MKHHKGPRGEAYQIDMTPFKDDAPATLDHWWIKTPNPAMMVAHLDAMPTDVDSVELLEVRPIDPRDGMDTFALSLITLSDVPGVPPANKRFPWVTHEFIIFTVDTTKGAVSHKRPMPWPLMQPHNLSIQFEVHSDEQALEVCDKIVWAIVNGMLLAEIQAYVPERRKMMTLLPLFEVWQDTVDKTAEHARTGGKHDEDPDRE